MRNVAISVVLGFTGMLVVAISAAGQTSTGASNAAKSPWKYYPMDRAIGDGGPAPKRDMTGTWAGPGSGANVPRGSNNENPTASPLTELGKRQYAEYKPIRKNTPASMNDPHARYCDP